MITNNPMTVIDRMPTVAVLDGDIIAYKAAFWAESEGIEELENRIIHDIKAWTPKGIDKVYVAVSCPRISNFRRGEWAGYKVRRDDDSRKIPELLGYAVELVTKDNKLDIPTLEADDIMGIMASGFQAVAVTIDKDLRSVRGWHWNPDKEPEPVLVDAQTAEYNFYKQWLMGDSTDSIPGVWKCGPVKASKILDSVQPQFWEDAVMYTYEHSKDAEGIPYTKDYCIKMARCVRILRSGEYCKTSKLPLLFSPAQ